MSEIEKINVFEVAENMREPKMRDIRALNHIKNDAEKEFALISNLTGVTNSELDNLSFKEYKVLQERLNDFLS